MNTLKSFVVVLSMSIGTAMAQGAPEANCDDQGKPCPTAGPTCKPANCKNTQAAPPQQGKKPPSRPGKK